MSRLVGIRGTKGLGEEGMRAGEVVCVSPLFLDFVAYVLYVCLRICQNQFVYARLRVPLQPPSFFDGTRVCKHEPTSERKKEREGMRELGCVS